MGIKKSKVELEILKALIDAGGTYTSAYKLIVHDLGRAWAHGYRCLDNLEREGLITIEHHEPPAATVIRLVNQ